MGASVVQSQLQEVDVLGGSVKMANPDLKGREHAGEHIQEVPLVQSRAHVKCLWRQEYRMPTILTLMGWRFFFYADEKKRADPRPLPEGRRRCKVLD